MNWFDLSILHFLNSFAHHSWFTDAFIVEIANNDFIDGGVLMAMVWWAWVEYGNRQAGKREVLALNFFVTAFAVVVARFLALSLPYRERPFREPLLNFQLPYTSNTSALIHWSSFPSDHAVLTFCVAAGLWMVSRRLGMLAAAYGLVTNLARVYAGIHYPTDVVVGLILGVGIAFLCKLSSLRAIARTVLAFLDQYPAYLYSLLFACTFEVAEMFNSVRHIAVLCAKGLMRFSAAEVNIVGIPILVTLLVLLGWTHRQNLKATSSTAPEVPPVLSRVND